MSISHLKTRHGCDFTLYSLHELLSFSSYLSNTVGPYKTTFARNLDSIGHDSRSRPVQLRHPGLLSTVQTSYLGSNIYIRVNFKPFYAQVLAFDPI